MCQTRSALQKPVLSSIYLSMNATDANGSQGFREGLEFLLSLDRLTINHEQSIIHLSMNATLMEVKDSARDKSFYLVRPFDRLTRDASETFRDA